MNNNVVTKEVTPRLPGIDGQAVAFVERLELITRFADIFMDGNTDELRSKRDELKAGIQLLDDPDAISHCEALIRAFESRLATIPHERYLSRVLAS